MVSADGVGGGVGECERKRGWMWASWLLELLELLRWRRRRGGTGSVSVESLAEVYLMGDCMGESGRGSFSGWSSTEGKGPSRGLAGETGRLPGMGSSFFFKPVVGLVTNGLSNPPCSTEDVSQASKPSPRQEISRELFSRAAAKLPDSRGVGV